MARNRNEAQFDEYRDWQWCKHVTLGDYAKPWSVIVGKTSRQIHVVDTCAGAATYTDPNTGETIAEGSPVIFARRAAAYTAVGGPGKSMQVICVEKNGKNYASLVAALKPYEPHVTTLRGSFHRHVPRIMEMVGNDPILCLLDPIGLATIRADSWRPLLERTGKTDLFIVLHFAGLHRVAGWLLPDGTPDPSIAPARRGAESMDAVFRGQEWRAIALDPELQGDEHREERERRYVQLFFDRVIGDWHRWKCSFEVRARYGAPVKYWLVHASDDFKPYMLMNDEIVKLNEMLLLREYPTREGMLEGFAEADLEAHREKTLRQLESAILECVELAPGGALPFGAIRDQLIDRFYGRVKQGAYWNITKALVKESRLRREKRAAAGVDERETISLPEPQSADALAGADVIRINRVA